MLIWLRVRLSVGMTIAEVVEVIIKSDLLAIS
jgi:hypothetical protein